MEIRDTVWQVGLNLMRKVDHRLTRLLLAAAIAFFWAVAYERLKAAHNLILMGWLAVSGVAIYFAYLGALFAYVRRRQSIK